MSKKTEAHQRLAEIMARRLANEKARVPPALSFPPLPPRPAPPALSAEARQERAARAARGKRYISYSVVWWLVSLACFGAWLLAAERDPALKDRLRDESLGVTVFFTLLMSDYVSCLLSAILAIVFAVWYRRVLPWKWIGAALVPTGSALFALLAALIADSYL